jgi:ferritin-like metal-binding protein YciE
MSPKDLLLSWLNNAYGMENNLVEVLEHQVKDAEKYPPVQAKLQEHLQQTRRHAEIVQGCIEQLGGSTSAIKSGMATVMGKFQALSTGAAQDEMIKNGLQDYAAESFEVASYTSLIAAAKQIGEVQVATACTEILREDAAMQSWLEQNIPAMTAQMMNELTSAGVS